MRNNGAARVPKPVIAARPQHTSGRRSDAHPAIVAPSPRPTFGAPYLACSLPRYADDRAGPGRASRPHLARLTGANLTPLTTWTSRGTMRMGVANASRTPKATTLNCGMRRHGPLRGTTALSQPTPTAACIARRKLEYLLVRKRHISGRGSVGGCA